MYILKDCKQSRMYKDVSVVLIMREDRGLVDCE